MMRRRSAAAIAAILLLAALPAAAAPVLAGESASARHDRIVGYWTSARMQSATPRDFVRTASGQFKPLAKPGTGGGGAVTGASWPDGKGEIYRTSGKVFFTMGGSRYVCSAAVANDTRSGYSVILTAAHCAYDEVADQFATNWMFIPQYDSSPTSTCANTAYGCWTASALVVHSGYASREGFDDEATWHDFAFAVVAGGGKSGTAQLDSTVGSFGLSFNSFPAGTKMHAFGYPAAERYKGNNLTYCAGPVGYDPSNASKTYRMDCDMTGGSSGGPWLTNFDEATGIGTLSSLNSYGYSGVRAMHGPFFNANTKAVYDRANTTTANAIVP